MANLIKIEELALLVGVSTKTINYWYWYKKAYPDDKYAKLLPDYIQEGPRRTRYWKREDVWAVIEFRKSIPKGRAGVMGEITHKLQGGK